MIRVDAKKNKNGKGNRMEIRSEVKTKGKRDDGKETRNGKRNKT